LPIIYNYSKSDFVNKRKFMSIDDFEETNTDQAFMKNSLYGRANEMTYGGALSFLRRKYTKDLTGVDIAVSGIPFDAATSFRPGARFGPKAIREASVQLAELLAYPDGIDPFKTLAVTDYGDCELDYGLHDKVASQIEAHATKIIDAGVEMLTFGGDHFVTYPLLRAHAQKHGPMALVHFDAHTDTWPDEGGRLDHGTMFSRAIKENLIDVKHSIQVGIRTHNSNTKGVTILDAPWVHKNGADKVTKKIIEAVKDRPAYLTFDIDCLDPAYAPGTGTPVTGGLTSAQALSIVRGLGSLNFIGADVVEVAPAYDHSEITAIAAATIAHDYLVLRAKQKMSAK
jgi:agmatinase